MPATKPTAAPTVIVDRKRLLTALQRVGRIIPNQRFKPILQGVRLEASDGVLHLSATDLDVSLTTFVEVEGGLPPCLVSCPELTQRVKAAKDDWCSIRLDRKGKTLTINGGTVDHTIYTLDLAEFPVIPARSEGTHVALPGQGLKSALGTALVGMAHEPTRYAINGVLLDSDPDGVRLVSTDGRRMVVVDLAPLEREFTGQVILPARFASLITKLLDPKADDYARLSVLTLTNDKGNKLPAKLFAAGRDWLLTSLEREGHFPKYTDVVPVSASQFAIDRQALLDTLDEVAVATNEESRGVQLDLRPRSLVLTAHAPQVGESTGTVRVKFLGGGNSRIITGFNPGLLRDALKTLSGDEVIIDVGQNLPSRSSDKVLGKPALLYSAASKAACLPVGRVRWLIMPVNTGLAASPETLGSNFEATLRASA